MPLPAELAGTAKCVLRIWRVYSSVVHPCLSLQKGKALKKREERTEKVETGRGQKSVVAVKKEILTDDAGRFKCT